MAVTLGNFTLTAVPTPTTLHVRADWDTQSEQDTAGFILKRGQNGTFTTISPIIPAIGDFSQGANYTYTDTTAVSGQTYTYQLFEITTSSSEKLLRELTFTPSFTPTNTPIPIGGGNSGGNNPQPTATLPPTSTPTATSLPATAVPTSVLAATPPPTATPTAQVEATASQPFVVPSLPTPAQAGATPTTPPDSSDNNNFIIIAPTSVVEGVGVQPVQAAELPSEAEESENPETTAVNPPPTNAPEQPVAIAQNNAAPAATPIIVGGRNPVPASPQQTEPEPAQARFSTFYLWGGFIAAMILFSAAVLGSIILFTRKREP